MHKARRDNFTYKYIIYVYTRVGVESANDKVFRLAEFSHARE